MKYTFVAPNLSDPTVETLQDLCRKRFKKIERLFPKREDFDEEIRISVEKERVTFHLTVETEIPELVVIKTSNTDLRKAITEAADQLKNKIRREKEKKNNFSKIKETVRGYWERLRIRD